MSRASIEGCLDACRRCQTLVDSVQAGDDPHAYTAIGPHLRHCIDHLHCLLRGIETGLVDYDARDREQVLEIDPARMVRELVTLSAQLEAIEPAAVRRPLRIRQSAAAGCDPVTVDSSLERELVFLSGHTIHHIAIMALLVRGNGIPIPDGLDMAFSTAVHLSAVAPD